MKKKSKSTQSTPHVQEQCGVWLSAKGRSKLQEGSNNQRLLPCTATPRQSRVVLGELIIPQPRPRIGGKQSTLSMFFKPVPVSQSSSPSILKCNGKESCHTLKNEVSKINPAAFPTRPLMGSRCNIPERLASYDSEGSIGVKENNSSDSGVKSLDCAENEIDGFTGCTLDMDSSDKDHLSKEDNSEESSVGKCSYVFRKADHAHGIRKGLRKRSCSPIECADNSLLVQDSPTKRCKTEHYSSEDSSETKYFGSERKEDQSETMENSSVDKQNIDYLHKISCSASKRQSEMVNSEIGVYKPGKFLNSNRTLTSKSGLMKTITSAKDNDKYSFISQNYSPLEVDDSSQSNASFETCLSEDDSLTPAILRNSIYRKLDLSSEIPLTNHQPSNVNETLDVKSCNSDEIPDTLAFDSLDEWAISANDSTEITMKF